MWQKARLLEAGNEPQFIGKCVWLCCEPPHDFMDFYSRKLSKGYNTNILDDRGYSLAIEPHSVELLPEFTENPGIFDSIEDWKQAVVEEVSGRPAAT